MYGTISILDGNPDEFFVQGTTLEAGEDIAAFMAIFFEHFTKFKGRALHLAGESYGVYHQLRSVDRWT